MWTTSTQILLKKSPPSHQLTTQWSLPSIRKSFETSPSLRPNCWIAKSLLTDAPACTCLTLSCICSSIWDCSHQYIQYDTVTFPRDMRVQSGEESAKHMLDKNWGCTWWTFERSCNSWKVCVWSAFEMTFSFDSDPSWFMQKVYLTSWCVCKPVCQRCMFYCIFALMQIDEFAFSSSNEKALLKHKGRMCTSFMLPHCSHSGIKSQF